MTDCTEDTKKPSYIKLKYAKGCVAIALGVLTPFGMWATGQATLTAAVVGGIIGGLSATYAWIDQALADEAPTVERVDMLRDVPHQIDVTNVVRTEGGNEVQITSMTDGHESVVHDVISAVVAQVSQRDPSELPCEANRGYE